MRRRVARNRGRRDHPARRPLFAQQYAPPWPAGGTDTNLACAAPRARGRPRHVPHTSRDRRSSTHPRRGRRLRPGRAVRSRVRRELLLRRVRRERDAESHRAVCASTPTPPPTTTTGLGPRVLPPRRARRRGRARGDAPPRRAPAAADDAAVLAVLGGLSAVPFDETLGAGGARPRRSRARPPRCGARFATPNGSPTNAWAAPRPAAAQLPDRARRVAAARLLRLSGARRGGRGRRSRARRADRGCRAPHVLRATVGGARCVDDDGAPEEARRSSERDVPVHRYRAVRPRSAFNHSCEPNCLMTTSNASAFEVIVVADRALAPGEELCSSRRTAERGETRRARKAPLPVRLRWV